MKLNVVDTETTGIGDSDQVMDIAIVSVNSETKDETWRWSSLIRPGVPCALEARAVHHITDAMVAGMWTWPEMMAQRGLEEFDVDSVFVAHNADFDLRMIRQTGTDLKYPVICTWRCARHLLDGSPSYSNQVLRYFLNLEVPELESIPPHRALPDALVTSRILMRLLDARTVEELIVLTKQPVLLKTVGFGKHRGDAFATVPKSYLRWILEQGAERPDGKGGKAGFDVDTRYTAQQYV